MKKLFFLIDRAEGGGAEKQMLQIMRLFSNECEIYISSLHSPSDYMLKCFKDNNINYINLCDTFPSSMRPLSRLRIIRYLVFIRNLRKEIISRKIDILFSFLEWSNVISIVSSFRVNVKNYINIRNHLSSQYRDRNNTIYLISRLLLKFFYNEADLVICNSEAIKEDLIDNYKVNNKIIVNYNIYDVDSIKQRANDKYVLEEIKDTDCKTFLSVGRLVSQKNLIQLVRTFNEYVEFQRFDKLLIIGSGPLEKELRDIACDNIEFIPHVNNPYPFFLKSDYFILNSKFEGFPNVLSEAIILDLYPIAVDCFSGPREILSNFKILNYKKELDCVGGFDCGLLYQKSNNDINENLLSALKIARSNIKCKFHINSIIKENNFGKDAWKCLL